MAPQAQPKCFGPTYDKQLTRTPPLLSRDSYQKTNQIEHVSTEGDIIHDRTRFRGPEYLVWLAILQCNGYLLQTEVQFGLVFDHIFSKILERSGDVPITIPKFRFVCFLSKSCHILQIVSYSQFYYFNRQKFLANFKCLGIQNHRSTIYHQMH